MNEEKTDHERTHVHIGTIGHVDHDKASLAEAINAYLEKSSKKETTSSHAISHSSPIIDKPKRLVLTPKRSMFRGKKSDVYRFKTK